MWGISSARCSGVAPRRMRLPPRMMLAMKGSSARPRPDGFHDDHGFHGAATEAAIFLAEGESEDAELGVFGPLGFAVAVRFGLGAAAEAEVVVGRADEGGLRCLSAGVVRR